MFELRRYKYTLPGSIGRGFLLRDGGWRWGKRKMVDTVGSDTDEGDAELDGEEVSTN